MSISRYVTVGGAGGALAFALLFACATNVELGEQDPQPDAGPGQMIPEAAAADSDAAVDAPADVAFDGIVTGACSPGGFCFQPVPIQTPLVAVSGSSPNDVWAVGGSTILRYRGTQWEQVYEYSGTTPASITFIGIWATQPENVLAVARDNNGRLVFVRYATLDGGAPRFYELLTTAAGTSVWVTPSSDAVWIANGSGTLTRLHEDGSGGVVSDDLVPRAFPGETKDYFWSSVWGFAPDDVYAAGVDYGMFGGGTGPRSPPMIAHYDGTSWTITILPLPGGMGQDSLSGTPPAGPQRLWLSTVESGRGGPVHGVALYPIEDGGIGSALLRETMTALSPCGSKYASATSPTAAWMSNGKAVCRWNGTKLEPFSTSLGGLPTGLVRGVWAASEDEVWIVGEAVPQGIGFPATGFAARRTKDAGAPQP